MATVSVLTRMSHVFRYFFNPGSGVCLWAESAEAKERFGYTVEHWELPLSEKSKRFLQHLIAWFDTSIDWSSPGDSDDYLSIEESTRFKAASARGFRMLKGELSVHGYEFIDETAA